jgi:hypothetical protein
MVDHNDSPRNDLYKLGSGIYIYLLGFPWHKQWHGLGVFSILNAFLNNLLSFFINIIFALIHVSFVFIKIVTSHLCCVSML